MICIVYIVYVQIYVYLKIYTIYTSTLLIASFPWLSLPLSVEEKISRVLLFHGSGRVSFRKLTSCGFLNHNTPEVDMLCWYVCTFTLCYRLFVVPKQSKKWFFDKILLQNLSHKRSPAPLSAFPLWDKSIWILKAQKLPGPHREMMGGWFWLVGSQENTQQWHGNHDWRKSSLFIHHFAVKAWIGDWRVSSEEAVCVGHTYEVQ